ncbi:dTDP-4-amino-4,6-dideoxygalactose transaminase [Actinomycetospora succinea]|uniref:dTDP-4-amino-4,6-dideoxygalactose transaminase n=2 Tax=Actinomycetospora succinea TaxID=663603 RepID=A0A4R6UPE2_9PSEU|nr:dTDP-4-amino-4,6-dideoxygalactose transaminase [Actinomycetospora succinea]
MTWTVPLTDVVVTDDDVAAVMDCYASGWLTMGPRTRAFEDAVAQFTGSTHAVAVSSGTAALHLACRAAGIGPGDEVIVPTMTFLATAHAPRYCGATPVLCDSASPTDMNLSVEDVSRRITPRTKAVIAVHFCGYTADLAPLRTLCDENGLVLIEDMAQAIGARYADGRPCGTGGDLACVSFFSKKQLSVGEGGAVLTGSSGAADIVRSLRSHAMTSGTWDRHRGHEDSYDIVDLGYNYRLDEPRAALGLARIPRLAAEIDARRAAVLRYRERLGFSERLTLLWDDEAVSRSSHFAFPVLTDTHELRVHLRRSLAEAGIQTTRYPALHVLEEYAGQTDASLSVAEATADRHLCLPLWAGIDDDTVDRVCERVLHDVREA